MTLVALSLATPVFAAPAGYTVTKSVDGCELSLGPAESDGVVPMRAECVWPDASMAKFDQHVGNWDEHDLFFTAVVDSDVRRVEGNKALVYQKHRSKGISDREVMLWMQHTVVDGYDRYSWTKAKGEPLTPIDGNVLCDRSDGFWQAKTGPAGGILVVHSLSYKPGGSVPGFLVRWFQTSGLEANVTELHAYLTSH